MALRTQAVFTLIMIAMPISACRQQSEKKTDTAAPEQEMAPDESVIEKVTAASSTTDSLLTSKGGQPKGLIPVAPLKILGIDSSGSGCPQNSIAIDISPDSQAFTLLFSEFVIAVDPAASKQKISRRCDSTLKLEVPTGWQFAIVSIDARGYADLPKGTKAVLTTKLSFTERKSGKIIRSTLAGPYADDFQVSKQVRLKASKWSRCGGNADLAIDLEARVKVPKNQSAYLAIDSLNGEMQQTLGLAWQKCG